MKKYPGFLVERELFLWRCWPDLTVAQAGDYSNVYFFGDSLSDNGAYAPLVGPNARFTTNPGTVWTDNLGAHYGKSVTTAYAAPANGVVAFTPITSGNNLAVGGARVSLLPGNMAGCIRGAGEIPPLRANAGSRFPGARGGSACMRSMRSWRARTMFSGRPPTRRRRLKRPW